MVLFIFKYLFLITKGLGHSMDGRTEKHGSIYNIDFLL